MEGSRLIDQGEYIFYSLFLALIVLALLTAGIIIGFKTMKTKITVVDMRTQEISSVQVTRTATIVLRRGGWDISTK